MGMVFKDETFRDDYSFSNSPEAIKRFPFPFDKDSYMYAVNMEPHAPVRAGSVYDYSFDVDVGAVVQQQFGHRQLIVQQGHQQRYLYARCA